MSNKTRDHNQIELLTYRQLADILGKSVGAVRNAVSRGFVPRGTRIAGIGVRWRRDEIERWLKAQLEGGTRLAAKEV
ncbi:Helix-turn-helix domain-containing protein [Nannocystis exedens]|uniref:Helix-turn-helix domain-containing protein n=1 Tax=Nannocystis exedens TaxID=54 RepID=A0A1I2BLT7_9BACT|nr:helix-turn-helix domain-containing protein [Nannocystis exedens]PCC67900.1 Helix-turn-helix domain protein [Nannocystis exedens]SFE57125.1 Helix-turn-helix domain-containing protein [Nannocystis exedens]